MKSLWLVLALALLATGGSAWADWDETMPSKWVQMPDLSPMGIDVNACNFGIDGQAMQYILADDFLCRQPGLITGIHVWGSWLDDSLPMNEPENVSFTLSIHADIPANQNPDGYSKPGEVLWVMDFQPGAFIVRPYAVDIAEGWLDAPDRYLPPPADTVCWQYNFPIDEAMAFFQEGTSENPIVYWLDLKAFPNDETARFGWKTSLEHWNDDAVWGQGFDPYPGPWWELRYPPGHELVGQSIDLAFVLVGEEQPDEYDFGDAPDPTYPTVLASNGARHLIGPLFLGASVDGEPDGQPNANATGDDADGNDDEDGVTFISALKPGLPATIDVVASQPGLLDAWIDFDTDGIWNTATEQIFSSQTLNTGPNTLTFSVPGGATENVTTFARFRVSSGGNLGPDGLYPTGEVPDGEVEDHEVFISGRYTFKWIQHPDLSEMGMDVDASPFFGDPGFILADDFLCTVTGHLTDIHIWGSWLNDYIPFMEDPRAVDFTLSIHSDIPADESPTEYSMPGELLWIHDFAAGDFRVEVFAEQILEGWMTPPEDYFFPGDTVCWLYKFHVDPHLAFFQEGTEDRPIVYWLDLKAKPHDPEAAFGWKTAVDHWNDDAVWAQGVESDLLAWRELIYPPGHELQGQSIDLAFALYEDHVTAVPDATDQTGLLNNQPNPFNPSTTIHFVMPPDGGEARIDVFDTRGRLVAVLVDGFVAGGAQKVTWDGRGRNGLEAASGVYFYRLTDARGAQALKMLLLR